MGYDNANNLRAKSENSSQGPPREKGKRKMLFNYPSREKLMNIPL